MLINGGSSGIQSVWQQQTARSPDEMLQDMLPGKRQLRARAGKVHAWDRETAVSSR